MSAAVNAAVNAAPPLNHDSPASIRRTLDRLGIGLKKRWGQNFLVNRGARARIVWLADPRPGELVWEIGPGLGAVTALLVERGSKVATFELDAGLCRYLAEEAFTATPSFTLFPGDFLRTWKAALRQVGEPACVLGNLPYRSAALMIASIIEGDLRPARCVFTVQRELAERLAARPSTKSYSALSVLCQACFEVEQRGELQPGSFWPVPDVVSSIVELRPLAAAPRANELELVSSLARALFSSRRKTIRNNLRVLGAPGEALAALEAEGIDPGVRAEELAPEVYVRLARRLARILAGSRDRRSPGSRIGRARRA